MRKKSNAVRTALVSGVAAALFSLSAHATLFSDLFAFGDSLSDAGNVALVIDSGALLPAIPPASREPTPFPPGSSLLPDLPYAEGARRLSNGPVWVEQLAANLGLSAAPSLFPGGTNYAYGGARTGPSGAPPTPPLVEQVAVFLGDVGGVASSDALYTVWGGANDLRDALDLADIGIAIAAANNIAATLAGAGAVNIIVPNLPDFGLTPAVSRLGPVAAGAGTLFSTTFNNTLALGLAPYIANPLLDVVTLDIFGLLNSVVAAPGASGLANVADLCVDIGSICGSPGDYLFWDGIHPTTAGHAIIVRAALQALQAVPEPAAVLLLVLVGVSGRRALRC